MKKVRIGFNAFWDVALISTFELALAAKNIEPEFVLLSEWHDSAIEAFRNDLIDVSVHNYHTTLYDKQLPSSKKVGIEWIAPLFIFRGHHIFVSRRHIIQRAGTQAIIKSISERFDDRGNPLPEGLFPGDGDFPEHRAVLRDLLVDAHIGFERGTDQEIAFRKAYDFAELTYPSEAYINRAADGSAVGRRGIAHRALSNELFHAFREDKIDLYCGGWPQLYQLRRESYPVLLGPDALKIDSHNGLLTTSRFSKDKVVTNGIIEAWFCGTSLFSKWARLLKTPDISGAVRARAEIEAILISVENSIRAPEGERLLEDEAEEFPVAAVGRNQSQYSSANTLSADPQSSLELGNVCEELRSAISRDGQTGVDIAPLIRTFLNKASLKPRQLADIARIADQTVYRWLKGESRPNADHVSFMETFVTSGRSRPALHDAIREAFTEEKRDRRQRVAEWAQLLCKYDHFDRATVEASFKDWDGSKEQALWKLSQSEYVRSEFLSQGTPQDHPRTRPQRKSK
jgi:hypothetical protein